MSTHLISKKIAGWNENVIVWCYIRNGVLVKAEIRRQNNRCHRTARIIVCQMKSLTA